MSVNTQKITGVSDPTAAQGVATKNYVDVELYSKDVIISSYIESQIKKRTLVNIKSSKRWSESTGKQYANLVKHIKNYENKKNSLFR